MAKPSYVGGKFYPTQQALTEFVKKLLDDHDVGATLSDEHHLFMLELLKRRPGAVQKIGCGVAAFRVRSNYEWGEHGGKGFYLVRVDGTEAIFSYHECIKPSTKYQSFVKTCRTEIDQQKLDFRRNFFDTTPNSMCPIMPEIRLTEANCHVDHVPPATFKNIVDTFIKTRGIDVDAVEIAEYEVFAKKSEFSSPELSALWQSYHQANAVLRVISKQANLTVVADQARKANRSGHCQPQENHDQTNGVAADHVTGPMCAKVNTA